MKRRLRFRLLWPVASLLLAGDLAAQSPASAERVEARYKELLLQNPSEAFLLDRLWKQTLERGVTADLLAEFGRLPGPNAALVHGHLLKRAGRSAEARASYERAAAMAPENPGPALALAELDLESDPLAAARAFETALRQINTKDHLRVEVLLKLGSAWQKGGESARATAAWEEAAGLEPNNPGLRWQLGQAYEAAGQPERAISAYRGIAEHAAPNDRLNALREISRLEQARDNFEGARGALEQALALTARGHWMRPELQQQLTRLYLRAGRDAEQEQRLQAEAERNPRDAGPLLLLANLYDELGDAAKQAASLEKAVKLTPRDRDLRLRLARVLADSGELQSATEQYDLLLREPGRTPPDWILARADLDLQLGHPTEAVARIAKLLASDGNDDSVRAACLAYYQRNHFEAETEELLKGERDRSPGNDEASLALVEYYFAQKKPDAALAALNRWSAPRDGEAPVLRAARLARAAELLKTRGSLADVVTRLRESIALDASSGPSRRMALADALLASGDTEAARRELDAAYAGAKNDSERNEVDDKLFALLQNLGAAGTTTISPGSRALVPARDNPVIREFLRDLDYAARESGGNADAGLRLARFYSRGGAPADAIEAALRALRLKPDSLPTRELVVRLAAETGRRELLAEQLQAIVKLDPAGRSKHLRRLAYARLEEGALTAAIALFRELEAMNPGSDEAVADLAAALQRAERWPEAVEAWERAYALPRAAKNHGEYRQPFVQALEKTGAARRAVEILAAAADGETDSARRVEMFRDAVAYAQHWNLLPWLEARTESRVRSAPLDYFAASSLAELRRAQGRDREAYELLTRAYYGAPDPPAALQNLVRTAEDLGDTKGALRHARRLLHLAGQLTVDNLERLAALEEGDLDFDAAARTWDQIVNRFPRDPGALARAADYFRKSDLPARERDVLAKLVSVDPTDLSRQIRLGTILSQDGSTEAARGIFESVLANSMAEPSKAALQIPDVDSEPVRLPVRVRVPRSRGMVVATEPPAVPPPTPAAAGGDARWRAEAIKQLSRMSLASGGRDGSAAKGWVERWRALAAAQPSEALAAFVYTGRSDLALDLLEERMRKPDTAEEAARAFVRVALQAGQFSRLGKWVWGNPDQIARRRDQMLDGLEAYLLSRSRTVTPPGLIEALFPLQFRSRYALWGDAVARIFVAQNRYADAAELGGRFLANTQTNRALYGIEIARWHLLLGDPERARATLRFALEGTNGADSFDAAYFEALRMMYELLPANERSAWAEAQRRRADGGGPATAALVGALLEGLAGHADSARQAIERWVELRPTLTHETEPSAANGFVSAEASAAARFWSAVLTNGTRLEAWNLHELARQLWRSALSDPVIAEMQDARAREIVREIRQRLRLNEWTSAPPAEADLLVAEFLSTKPSLDDVSNLATGLSTRQQQRLALRLREYAFSIEPADGTAWRSMLGALRAGGDSVALRAALERQLTRLLPASAAVARREWIVQLTDLDEKAGNFRAARDTFETQLKLAPKDTFLRLRLAQLLERNGLQHEAAEAYREVLRLEPDFPLAVLALAGMEEQQGNVSEALALLEMLRDRPSGNPGELTGRCVAILIRANQIERARTTALSMVRSGYFAHLPRAAELFAEKGERAFAADLLRLGIQKCREAQLRFNLAQALLENHLTPADDPATFGRELRRLGQIAAAEPRLQLAFQNVRQSLARKNRTEPALEATLRAEWRNGAGDALSGQKLMLLLAGAKREEEVRVVAREYLARPDAIDTSAEPGGQPVFQLADSLLRAGSPEVVADLMAPLIQRYPQNSAFALTRATALYRSGRRAEAEGVLRKLDATWLIQPEISGQIASTWLDLGDSARAMEAYERAVERDSDVESPQNFLALAKLKLAAGDTASARKLLRDAYHNPGTRDLSPLLDLLAATEFDAIEAPAWQIAGDFLLRPELRRQLPAALCLRLLQTGRIDAARRMAAAHPAMLIESPEVAARLRETTEAGDFAAVGAIFQLAWQQSFARGERFERESASFQTRWAEVELQAGRPEAALGHLLQARNYSRADFPSARRLAELRVERGERNLARAVLNDYLACRDASDADRDKARAMLAAL